METICSFRRKERNVSLIQNMQYKTYQRKQLSLRPENIKDKEQNNGITVKTNRMFFWK